MNSDRTEPDLPAVRSDGLPAPASPILGRDLQLEQAINLLAGQNVRLLTIAGPGGIGKSRFALELAHRLSGWLRNGVMFVGLESVRDASLVAGAIARSVGVLEQTGNSEADLIRWLRDDDRLLVLDNVEQILEAAPLLTRLLTNCPGIRIVVTSRVAPLHLSGERVFEVGPLAFPEVGADFDIDPADYPSVAYFLQHAPSVDWQTSQSAVIRICQRLEGIPLALELAGARVGLLSVEEIADQTTGWMPLLTLGRRDAPERHRTMERTIEWSYQLLEADLQSVFRKLSVFSGGFSREAATLVAGASPGDLTTLIESRLLEASTSRSRAPRFRLLEPVRDFGILQNSQTGEMKTTQAALATWASEISHSVSPAVFNTRLYYLEGPNIEEMLELERGNFEAALSWLIAEGDAIGALQVAGMLSDFWYRRMYPAEGLKWLGATLDIPRRPEEEVSRVFIKSCLGMALLEQVSGNGERAMELGNLGLATARKLGEIAAVGEAIAVLGYVALNHGEIERSIELSEQALAIFRQPEYEDRSWQVDLQDNLALAVLQHGNVDRASTLIEDAVALAREIGDIRSYAATLNGLADVRCHQHRFSEALDAASESFEISLERHGAASPEMWQHAVHGMAGCSTIAYFAFPSQTDISLPMVIRTEVLCRQLGTAKPDNRVTYELIRDEFQRLGSLQERPPAEGQTVSDLNLVLDDVRTAFAQLHDLITAPGDQLRAKFYRRPGPRPRAAGEESGALALAARLTPKQLETIRAIVAGKTAKEIAAQDGVVISSVYQRIDHIRASWGLSRHASLVEVAVFAVRHGID